MHPGAHVHEVATLEEWRGVIITFCDAGTNALEAIGNDAQKVQDWLEAQHQQWQVELRKAEDALFVAKQELVRQRNKKIGDRHPDTGDQEKAVRRAQQKLDHVEEKLAATKNWMREWPNEIQDYEGHGRRMRDYIDGDLAKACIFLEQKILALEAYLATLSPAAAPPPPSQGKAR